MIIFGAGVIGEATLHACRAKGIPVECFVDHRIVGPLMGLEVHTLATLPYDTDMYLTSPNIEDMILPAEEMGYGWHSCGDVLHDFDISGIEFQSINGSNESSRYSTEHVQYLIRTCLHHHDNYLQPERLTVQSVDLMITEKCSMKCRDCSNLMQYYEHPENADMGQMLGMIDGLCAKMDEIYEFRVIGGEPFMHREIDKVVAHVCAKPNVRKVSIFTNATIVPREHQWAAFQHPKVRFFITDYDELSRNIRPLVEALDDRKIAYVSEKANGWTDCASLEKHNRTLSENEALWRACCAKNLATLADGRLYRCPFSANATKLGAVPDHAGDYLAVAGAQRDEIRDFLRGKTHIEACDWCNGRSYDAPVIKAGIQVKKPLTYRKYVKEIA
jgi:MoaA/NifB/PqqE/SkfB family radical SAM enzyme